MEDFEEITIRHSKYAAFRFAAEAEPALIRFAESSPMPFVNGIKAARERIVARDDEDSPSFLRKRGFSKAETTEDHRPCWLSRAGRRSSIFDFVQGITGSLVTSSTRMSAWRWKARPRAPRSRRLIFITPATRKHLAGTV